MANVFMCHLEEQLARESLMPQLYGRYVDDTLVRMPDAATVFLTTLNGLPSSLTFTVELPENGTITFIGIEIIKNGRLRLKFTERQQTLVYSYIVRVILTNVIKSVC